MLAVLLKNASIKDFSRKGKYGQIATLLMLLMVVFLIFIMVTVNLGQVSLTATVLSNAADAAVLSLGSQLVSRAAHMRNEMRLSTEGHFTEPPPMLSKSTGILSIVFSVILSAIAVVVTLAIVGISAGTALAFLPYLALIAAGSGGIGGYIGGGIQSDAGQGFDFGGKGAWEGALQGAGVGLAVASAVVLPTKIGLGTGGVSYYLGAGAGTGLTVSNLVGRGLSGLKGLSMQMPGIQRSLKALPVMDQVRESIFLQVLSRIVDDPNLVPDERDLSGRGDPTLMVPAFSYWLDDRVNKLKEETREITALINNFIAGPMHILYDHLSDNDRLYGKGMLHREGGDKNGYVIDTLWGFKHQRSEVNFCPNKDLPDNWNCYYQHRKGHASPGAEANDDLDMVTYLIGEILELAYDMIETRNEGKIYRIVSEWPFWIKNARSLIGDMKEKVIHYLFDDITQEVEKLPVCETYDCWSEGGPESPLNCWVKNAPCRDPRDTRGDYLYAGGERVKTVFCHKTDRPIHEWTYEKIWPPPSRWDLPIERQCVAKHDLHMPDKRNWNDRYLRTKDKLKELRAEIQYAYQAVTALAEELARHESRMNPVSYRWTDARGEHIIEVEIPKYWWGGSLKFSSLGVKLESSWLDMKKTLHYILEDYSDDGNNTWVKVTRMDEARKSAGILGFWNPWTNFTDEEDRTWVKITRQSYVNYGLYRGDLFSPYVNLGRR